jgi:hypothetical protein
VAEEGKPQNQKDGNRKNSPVPEYSFHNPLLSKPFGIEKINHEGRSPFPLFAFLASPPAPSMAS